MLTFATEDGNTFNVEVDLGMELENVMALLEAEASRRSRSSGSGGSVAREAEVGTSSRGAQRLVNDSDSAGSRRLLPGRSDGS